MDATLINLYHFNGPTIEYLHNKGIIGFDAKERLEIYTFYFDQLNKGVGRMEAFTITAKEYNKSEDRVQGIIYQLNKDVRIKDKR